MQAMKYNLKEINHEQSDAWNELLCNSLDSNIFQHPHFLKSYNATYRLFILYKGTQEKAGVVCLVDKLNPNRMVSVPGIIHDGIFFKKNFVDSTFVSKINSIKFEIIEFIINDLSTKFENITFTLNPEILDIRPFLWFNYHSTDSQNKFNIAVRYTSYQAIDPALMDEENLDANLYFKGLSNSRRQEIRYAVHDNTNFTIEQDYSEFYKLYQEMAATYDPEIDQSIALLKNVEKNLKEFLKMFYIRDAAGKVVAAALFSVFNNKACYLNGATSKSDRESYSGSYILWQAMKYFSKQKISLIDWEGVNSPKRGWFKLSFGGELKPYYRVEWQPNKNK